MNFVIKGSRAYQNDGEASFHIRWTKGGYQARFKKGWRFIRVLAFWD